MFSVDHNEAEEGLCGGDIMQGAILLTISFCPQHASQLYKSFFHQVTPIATTPVLISPAEIS